MPRARGRCKKIGAKMLIVIPGKICQQQRWRQGKYVNPYNPSSKEKRLVRIKVCSTLRGSIKLKGKIRFYLKLFYKGRKRYDGDNVLKFYADALEGICYEDDRQIYDYHVITQTGQPEERVEVEVYGDKR